MKTGTISELSSFLKEGTIPGVQASQDAKGESFSSIMSGAAAANAANSAAGGKAMMDAGVKNSTGRSFSNSEGRSAVSANESGKVRTQKTNDPDRKETMDRLDEAAGRIRDELKEKLGVSDEEIDEAMEVLGLSFADIFDPAALTQLYTQLAGATDQMSLLTDETMYSGLQDVLADVQALTDELKEELGLSDEQLKASIEAFSVQKNEDEPVAVRDEDADYEVAAQSTGEVDDTSANVRSAEQKTDTDDKEEGRDDRPGNEKTHSENGTHVKDNEPGFVYQGPAPDTLQGQEQVQTADAPAASYSTRESAMIARQLVEQIRLNVTSQTTSLEMELNPASLGHVSLNIEARNGLITASFTAQNEAVRAVIENQMVMLRENLESQGIRIEAVEVTVASHRFDENLNRGNEENRRREETQATVRAAGRRMRINLLGEDEQEEEELSEEEEINRDMMIRSGNSMDVTA